MYAALQAPLLLIICSEGMGVQRNEDVICIYIYIYLYIPTNCITYMLDFT